MGRIDVFSLPIVGLLGLFLGAGGNLMLAAAAGDPSSIGVVITGGGAGVVVSVMAWIIKKVVSGELVPVPISEVIKSGVERDQKLDRIIELLMNDRNELKAQSKLSTEANFAVYEFLRNSGASTKGLPPGAAPSRSQS